MDKSEIVSRFLRALADAVDALDERELQGLLRSSKLDTLLPRSGSRGRSSRTKTRPDPRETREIAQAMMRDLLVCESREDAQSFLDDFGATRAILVEAAKLRDVPVAKQDTVPFIKQKLVANAVGSRLDSAAIRGERD